MTYVSDLHTYLHQSSLLIQAYPNARITTKYSLPRKSSGNPSSKRSQKAAAAKSAPTNATDSSAPASAAAGREKREPAATLTLKTFHADTGICLKYRTDKAQEVGRLLSGLGRLAKGEVIEMPAASATGGAAGTGVTAGGEDKMDVDGDVPPPTPAVGSEGTVKEGKAEGAAGKSAAEMTHGTASSGGGGGGGKKKKKGGKK